MKILATISYSNITVKYDSKKTSAPSTNKNTGEEDDDEQNRVKKEMKYSSMEKSHRYVCEIRE